MTEIPCDLLVEVCREYNLSMKLSNILLSKSSLNKLKHIVFFCRDNSEKYNIYNFMRNELENYNLEAWCRYRVTTGSYMSILNGKVDIKFITNEREIRGCRTDLLLFNKDYVGEMKSFSYFVNLYP